MATTFDKPINMYYNKVLLCVENGMKGKPKE